MDDLKNEVEAHTENGKALNEETTSHSNKKEHVRT